MHSRLLSNFRNSGLGGALLLGLLACGRHAVPAATGKAPVATAAYTNPVWPQNFPDPTIIHAADGYYYAYGTQGDWQGKELNLQVARSTDLTHWQHLGDALPVKPTWASTTYSFWAPHVSEVGGTYYLYYSAKPDNAVGKPDAEAGLCLAVATATSPAGPFTDSGQPLQCGTGFINIDPMAFDDPATGRRLLYWGSGFGPLKVRELAPDRVSFVPGSEAKPLVLPTPGAGENDYQTLIEGSWVVLRNGWYYLFYSGNNCCGPKAHYAVEVARSRNATGPFETLAHATGGPSSVILVRNQHWLAPGHNSVVTDAAGQDWIAYHAIDVRPNSPTRADTTQAYASRLLLLDRLEYHDGWPHVVPNTGTPSVGAVPAPVVN